MNGNLRKHHRATLRHIAALQEELDHTIRQAQALADEAPEDDAFNATLEHIAALHARIRAARKLAVTLNQLLPAPNVRLVPPTPQRLPTPRPRRARAWANVLQMPARATARSSDTPT